MKLLYYYNNTQHLRHNYGRRVTRYGFFLKSLLIKGKAAKSTEVDFGCFGALRRMHW